MDEVMKYFFGLSLVLMAFFASAVVSKPKGSGYGFVYLGEYYECDTFSLSTQCWTFFGEKMEWGMCTEGNGCIRIGVLPRPERGEDGGI
jgi:hypothetical protein